MAVKAPRYEAPAAAAPGWTGFYLGGSLGVKQATADWTTTSLQNPLAPPGAFSIDGSSPATYRPAAGRFGGFLGYDLQIGSRWVAGLEFDAAYSDGAAGTAGIPGCAIACILGAPGPGVDVSSVTMRWDASARGRLGYLVSPNVLIYGTGGIAWQNIRDSATCQNSLTDAVCPTLAGSPFSTVTNNSIRTGWTVGAGIDARVYGNWMLRGEYRYSDFGTWNNSLALGAAGPSSATTVGTQLKISTQIGMVGIIYKFGSPLAASY
jgi:outer membrane immunogenic protein